jgi:hypothetical protein
MGQATTGCAAKRSGHWGGALADINAAVLAELQVATFGWPRNRSSLRAGPRSSGESGAPVNVNMPIWGHYTKVL